MRLRSKKDAHTFFCRFSRHFNLIKPRGASRWPTAGMTFSAKSSFSHKHRSDLFPGIRARRQLSLCPAADFRLKTHLTFYPLHQAFLRGSIKSSLSLFSTTKRVPRFVAFQRRLRVFDLLTRDFPRPTSPVTRLKLRQNIFLGCTLVVVTRCCCCQPARSCPVSTFLTWPAPGLRRLPAHLSCAKANHRGRLSL